MAIIGRGEGEEIGSGVSVGYSIVSKVTKPNELVCCWILRTEENPGSARA